MSNDTENRPLRRIHSIIELVEKLIKNNPRNETFYTDLAYFREHDWRLEDTESLESAFNTITKESKGAVSINFDLRPIREASAAGEGRITGHTVSGIRVHIDDPAKLNVYRADIENKLEKRLSSLNFVADVSGDDVILSTEDGTSTCTFNAGKRKQLMKILLSEKRYFECSELARELETTEKTIRQTIGYIRERVSKDLKVPTSHIISNDPDTGDKYGFLNVTVK